MRIGILNGLSMTAISIALALPAAAYSQVGEAPTEPQQKMETPPPASTNLQQGRMDALEMVRGTVALTRGLDADKDHDGSQFEAKLTHPVHLKNGPKLAKGTVLMGTVENDDMQVAGKSKLAVRFTEAKMGNGETVPIKATIVQVYPPVGLTQDGSPLPDESSPGYDADDHANEWNRSELTIDQIGALKDVDLHSRLASLNSGVFVSTKKDDVKLMKGSRMELALADSNQQQASSQQ